jgi:type II secretory pathway pseudopilin PulG
MNFKKLGVSRQGYTIDQTILIVAIIAILITLVIVTIGWTLLNRTSGTKLASQLGQINDAVAQFYDTNRTFPTNLAALQNAGLVTFRVSGTGYVNDFGGDVQLRQLNTGTTSTTTPNGLAINARYIWIQQQLVPLAEARRTDENIDGVINGQAGRVNIINRATGVCPSGSLGGGANLFFVTPTAANVTICYAASLM